MNNPYLDNIPMRKVHYAKGHACEGEMKMPDHYAFFIRLFFACRRSLLRLHNIRADFFKELILSYMELTQTLSDTTMPISNNGAPPYSHVYKIVWLSHHSIPRMFMYKYLPDADTTYLQLHINAVTGLFDHMYFVYERGGDKRVVDFHEFNCLQFIEVLTVMYYNVKFHIAFNL